MYKVYLTFEFEDTDHELLSQVAALVFILESAETDVNSIEYPPPMDILGAFERIFDGLPTMVGNFRDFDHLISIWHLKRILERALSYIQEVNP